MKRYMRTQRATDQFRSRLEESEFRAARSVQLFAEFSDDLAKVRGILFDEVPALFTVAAAHNVRLVWLNVAHDCSEQCSRRRPLIWVNGLAFVAADARSLPQGYRFAPLG
ncbi:hypothetical protein [Bradyrhizobium ottawaense]|uniref:hypothetical protein n=1 Tax=Bradyrhizobium ottawaense TaxID=931866 RepID=UPI0015CEFBA2|nr:hypothetical protein [Bradyrhizobium ottawaense]